MMAILFFYIWLLGWNVHGWISYRVNYKYVFRFRYQYSEPWKIFQIGAIFSTLLLISLLWYLLIQDTNGRVAHFLEFIPKDLLPLMVLLLFIGYVAFPHRTWLNGRGRRHIWHLVLEIFKTPFIPTNFTMTWVTDQLASLAQPLKDLEYTICFYVSYFQNDEAAILQCQGYKRISRGLIMALIALTLRCLQCLRQAYDAKTHREKKLPLINFGKYTCSIMLTVLSYLVNITDAHLHFFILWIVFAAIASVYTYIWDLTQDWDWLHKDAKHKLLRDELAYKRPIYYYIVMVSDILMRFAAQLSLSTPVITPIMKPALYQFVIALVAVFQRGVWNFFRVENAHLHSLGGLHVVLYIPLPYESDKFPDKIEEDNFEEDLKAIMGHEDSFLRGHMNDVRLFKRDWNRKLMHQQTVLDDEDINRLDSSLYGREATLYQIKCLCEEPICKPDEIQHAKIEEFTEEVIGYIERNKDETRSLAEIKDDVDQFIKDLRVNVRRYTGKSRVGETQVEILGDERRKNGSSNGSSHDSINGAEDKKRKKEKYPTDEAISREIADDHLNAILQEGSCYEPLLQKENEE